MKQQSRAERYAEREATKSAKSALLQALTAERENKKAATAQRAAARAARIAKREARNVETMQKRAMKLRERHIRKRFEEMGRVAGGKFLAPGSKRRAYKGEAKPRSRRKLTGAGLKRHSKYGMPLSLLQTQQLPPSFISVVDLAKRMAAKRKEYYDRAGQKKYIARRDAGLRARGLQPMYSKDRVRVKKTPLAKKAARRTAYAERKKKMKEAALRGAIMQAINAPRPMPMPRMSTRASARAVPIMTPQRPSTRSQTQTVPRRSARFLGR